MTSQVGAHSGLVQEKRQGNFTPKLISSVDQRTFPPSDGREITRTTSFKYGPTRMVRSDESRSNRLDQESRTRIHPEDLSFGFERDDKPSMKGSKALSNSVSRDIRPTKHSLKHHGDFCNDVILSYGKSPRSRDEYDIQPWVVSSRGHIERDAAAKTSRVSATRTRNSLSRPGRRQPCTTHQDHIVDSGVNLDSHPSKNEFMVPRAQTFVGKSNQLIVEEKLGRRHKTSIDGFRRKRSSDLSRPQGNFKPKEKFRHSVRLILILLKWVAEITKNSAKHRCFMDQLATFSEMAQAAYNTDDLRNSELAFDVSYFKANKDINLSAEVKEILSLAPAARTKKQLQTVLFGLQHLRSFAEYPLHMQEKLCRVSWYERIPARRIIIRQGHTAENFYFILSGKAIVKRVETNPVTGEAIVRTAAVMTKGMSFGELALLHHSRRTATVVSQDPTQLLTISRRDFMDIFMRGSAAGQIPDHIKFVNSLEFMNDWPIENLMEHPEFCLFHFFKRGVLIVHDSRQSDWLYIVKSGACQVMKELKAATPSSPICKKTKKIDLSLELPKLGTGEQAPRIDDGRKRGVVFNSVPQDIKIAMSEFASNVRKSREKEQDDENTPNSPKGTANNLPRISSEDPQTLESSKKLQNRASSIKVGSLVGETAPGPGFSRSKFNRPQSKRHRSYAKATSSTPDIRTGTPENHCSTTRSPVRINIEKENTPNSVFVQVQLLKPRDCFGLTSIQFDDDVPISETSVSLVSRGAECIMLSKQFFMRHANEKVRMELRRQIRPYPTANTFQENLQIQVDWDNYRRELLKDITTQHEVQSTARKTAR